LPPAYNRREALPVDNLRGQKKKPPGEPGGKFNSEALQ
jgi:hypothetical protein